MASPLCGRASSAEQGPLGSGRPAVAKLLDPNTHVAGRQTQSEQLRIDRSDVQRKGMLVGWVHSQDVHHCPTGNDSACELDDLPYRVARRARSEQPSLPKSSTTVASYVASTISISSPKSSTG